MNLITPTEETRRAFTFNSTHSDFPDRVYDLSEFALGGPDAITGERGAHKWTGGFSGRPGLLQDLMPTIAASYCGRSPNSVRNMRTSLRSLWRFLDGYEAWLRTSGVDLPRVDRLHQVTGVLLSTLSEPGPNRLWKPLAESQARTVRALILDAVHDVDLPELNVSALPQSRTTPKDTPSDLEGLEIIRHLRGEVLLTLRRWQRADKLAAEGRDLVVLARDSQGQYLSSYVPTEADAHATYRALVRRVGYPLPNAEALNAALGLKADQVPRWWPQYGSENLPAGRAVGSWVSWEDCAAGLYPTSGDVSTFALLCLGRTAWNPVTLLSLDVRDWHSVYDAENAWIYACKDRAAGALQYTISTRSHATGVYQVINRLIQRNAPLRSWLESTHKKFPNREIALRSPWLGTAKTGGGLFCSDPKQTATLNNHLRNHTRRLNASPTAKVQVRPMTSGDFRDVAAAVMYRESRYSMWVLKLLLGHKNLATTRSYGFRHAGRQESHRLVVTVLDDALTQIASSGNWDSTLTRAKVEGVEVTPDKLLRLQEYRGARTYSGALCTDPCHPPVEIDPTHPQDGNARCVQGHLCIARSCPRAIALNDSMSDICKCVADLEWRQAHVGAVRFGTGSEGFDLEYLRETLKQWPTELVESCLDLWRQRILSGEHRPFLLAGQH